MHSVLSSTATLLVSVLATSVLAAPQNGDSSNTTSSGGSMAVHAVQVGPGLTFSPESLTAAEGDWVEFTFGSGHSVAQSSFDAPCVPLASGAGVYSGFPDDGDVWRFQVNSTSPIWLYCSRVGHCEGGMSLVVNPPDNENTLDAYKAASANAQTSSPDTIQGGVFGAASDDSSSNGTTTGGSDSSSTSSTTTSGSTSSSTSATGSAASASGTGNAAVSNVAKNSLFAAGALAGAVAAFL